MLRYGLASYLNGRWRAGQGLERGGRGPSAGSEARAAQEAQETARHRRDARAMPKDEEDYFKEVSSALNHGVGFSLSPEPQNMSPIP